MSRELADLGDGIEATDYGQVRQGPQAERKLRKIIQSFIPAVEADLSDQASVRNGAPRWEPT